MQLLVISTPQDVQQACLSMEVTEHQSLALVEQASENDCCVMELPAKVIECRDGRQLRYGRIFHEEGQWFLEAFLADQFRVNEQGQTLEANRPQPLVDGDLIECHGYTLMFSDFSPWKRVNQQESVLKETVVSEIGASKTENAESGHSESDHSEKSMYSTLRPDLQRDAEEVNDPFELLEQAAEKEKTEPVEVPIKTAISAVDAVSTPPVNTRQGPLIDVLADFNDESSTHDQPMWTGEQQLNFCDDFLSGHPLAVEPEMTSSSQDPVVRALDDGHFQQALIKSLLETLQSVSPEELIEQVEQPKSWFRKKKNDWLAVCQQAFDQQTSSDDFQKKYLRCLRTCYEEMCE